MQKTFFASKGTYFFSTTNLLPGEFINTLLKALVEELILLCVNAAMGEKVMLS